MAIENDRTGTMTGTGGGDGRSGGVAGDKVETAKAEAGQVAGKAKEAGKEVMDEVTEKSAEVASTAKDEFNRLVDDGRAEIRTVGRERSEQLAARLETWAQQMRALSEGRVEEAGELRSWMQQAQRRVEDYASSLRERGPDGLMQDARRFARRRPGMFLLAAGVTGFALGRLVRSGAMSGSQDAQSGATPGYGSNGWYNGARTTDDLGTDNLGSPVEYGSATAVVIETEEALPSPIPGTQAGWPNQ
jgi:hypothetical protein